MWPYIPHLLATPVPRYTSFPTAAEFAEGLEPADYQTELAGLSGTVSLYVHIPFCDKICWYCGCNTGAANKKQRLASYLDALHREIALVSSYLPDGVRIGRIAFGGGSPNAIAPVDFVRLFDAIILAFKLDNPVISMELDPRSLTEEWVPVLKSIGASRASLGVQTFSPHCQAAIGRVQPLCMIDRTTRWLRQAGITSLNYDLMYGLPGQTAGDVQDSLTLAHDLGADRLAVFGYAHVPHLIPRQRRIDDRGLPDLKQRFQMAELAHQYCTDRGMRPIGFDHFAQAADPLAIAAENEQVRRNFQGFTDDPSDAVIGLGASSISSLPNMLVQNDKNSGRYRMQLSQGLLPVALGVRRSAQDQQRAKVIEDVLCAGRAKPGLTLLEAAWPRLAPFIEAGVCDIAEEELVIGPHGVPYARGIAATFDPYRQPSARRFSSAV